jgi:hypothetical protein
MLWHEVIADGGGMPLPTIGVLTMGMIVDF